MTTDARSQLTDFIVNKLNYNKEQLKEQFFCAHPIKIARYFTLNNLLPSEIAQQIYAHFPQPNQMHLLKMHGKLKLKYSHLRDASSLIQDINAAIQNPEVVSIVEAYIPHLI